MTREQIVTRALSACGQGCKYALGKGGTNPMRAVPWNEEMECDCSGFVLWCFRMHRMVWLDTWRIHALATGALPFREVGWLNALPGDGLVWPDRTDTNKKRCEGHIGVIAEVGPAGPSRVVHCSAGNYRDHGDAIRETDAELFTRNGAIAVRPLEDA